MRTSVLAALLLSPQLVAAEPMKCEAPSSRVDDAEQRFNVHGFTIQPPSSGYWCSLPVGPTMHTFVSNKFFGTELTNTPSREELVHSFAVVGMAITIKESDRGRFESLKELLEAWIEQGSRGFDVYGPIFYADFSPQDNFSPGRSSVVVDETIGAECVRYDLAIEERDNPGVPRRWVLLTSAEGITCRHPDDENLLIDVAFTERKREGWQDEDAGLRDRLRAESQSTLDSLQFAAIEPLEIDDSLRVAEGDELPRGATVSGSLDSSRPTTPNGAYYQSWHIVADEGQRLDISMNSDEFDAMLIVGRNVDGVFGAIAGDDDGGRRTNARLKYKVPEDGVYIVMALSARPGETGTYTLKVK